MEYLRRSKLEVGVMTGEYLLVPCRPENFIVNNPTKDLPANDKGLRPDKGHMAVAVLSEQLKGSGVQVHPRNSYVRLSGKLAASTV